MVWGHPDRIVWTLSPEGFRALGRDLTADTNGRSVISIKVTVGIMKLPGKRSTKLSGAQHLRGRQRSRDPRKEEAEKMLFIS